jgi:hypothetical protein
MRSTITHMICLALLAIGLSACDAESITTPPQNGDNGQSESRFGGSSDDIPSTVLQTDDGGILIAGTTYSADGDFAGLTSGNGNIFLMRLDPAGDIDWISVFGGSGEDRAKDLITDREGNFVITGHTQSNDGDFSQRSNFETDIFLLKISPNGQLLWSRTFGGSSEDKGYAVTEMPAGGYLITGSATSLDGDFSNRNNFSSDAFVIRTTADGIAELTRTVGGNSNDYGTDILVNQNSRIVITGTYRSIDGTFSGHQPGAAGLFIMEMEQNGTIVQVSSFGGSGIDSPSSLTLTQDDGYAIAGSTTSADGTFQSQTRGQEDGFVIKLNASMNRDWVQTVGGSNIERIQDIIENESGRFAVTGLSRSNDRDFQEINRGETDAFYSLISANGTLELTATYGGSSRDQGHSIWLTQNLNYLITGWTQSSDGTFEGPDSFSRDIFLITIDERGELL